MGSIVCRDTTSKMIDFNWHLPSEDSEIKKIFEEAIRLGIKGAVVTVQDDTKIDYPELLLRRVLPIKTYDVDPTEIEGEIRRSKIKVAGIKINPRNLQRFPSVKELESILKCASENNLFLEICTYPAIGPGVQPGWRIHEVLAEAMFKMENSKIILMHGGVSDLLSTSEMARRFPEVYLDLSFTITRMFDTSIKNDLQWLMSSLDTKCIFGSDTPNQKIDQAIKNFQLLTKNIEKSKTQNIASNNALKLLGL
jgi:predicted TIM-barrel fold metal-dependent hydrolase